jgi:hypothetical protein
LEHVTEQSHTKNAENNVCKSVSFFSAHVFLLF